MNKESKAKIEYNKKPPIGTFLHINELNVDSKKQILIERKEEDDEEGINFFDIKNQNIKGIDFSNLKEDSQFLNNKPKMNTNINKNLNNNPFNLNREPVKRLTEINVKENNMKRKTFQVQNKKILMNQKQKKRQKKMKKKNNKKTGNKRSSSTINNNLDKSNVQSKQNNSSQFSNKSGNSTKRSNYALIVNDTPERYPDDYLSIDSSEDEEKIYKKKEFQINNSSSLYKDIIENGKILNKEFDPCKKVKQELEEFDLMSINAKKIYKDKEFKKKYFKNIVTEIKIVYLDKEFIPLHAVFIFNEPNLNNNSIKREKKLFPGSFSKDEFIDIFSKALESKKNIKVELLMDYVELSKSQDLSWLGINPSLFIDFYILVNVLE